MQNSDSLALHKSPSSAFNPDLDWSQIRETVMLLNLSIAHIANSMVDGDESVNTLTATVTSMIDSVKIIGDAAAELRDSPAKTLILEHYAAVDSKIQEVIISFQFYDKLVQRLNHASNGLADLVDLVSNNSRLYNPAEWNKLQELIKSKYTVETDSIMFEALRNGATITEALALAREKMEANMKANGADTIELF
ncbi:MAG: hypothetical protein FD130_1351 [Halothiobacillaceae bacterium]|nr:MAG: hypothetical protein FD130_1351 [Halothiobacillaceae bacterium]